MIKKVILLAVLVIAFSASTDVFGVEFMYRGNKGYDHYSCGSDRRGGFVRVKKIGPMTYQIYGKRISGIFEISNNTVESGWCLGTVGAARLACGSCRFNSEKIPAETQPAN